MQRLRLRFFQVFENNGRLENRGVANPEDRGLAERRNRQEPAGLVGKIDIDPLEGNALLGQRDHRALHIGTQFVADQF